MNIIQTLPKEYIEKIKNLFGEEGEKWLDNLENVINDNIKKYGLTDLKPVKNLSYNFVATAKSTKYGDVIIKIGLPDKDTIQEITALSIYNGNHACKCYEHDFKQGFYILEKLNPGTSLLNKSNREKRIEIFSDLAKKLPVKVESNIKLPTFRETIDKAFNIARKDKKKYEKIIEYIEIADTEYKKIEDLNLDKYVLHGDLHHENILLDGDTYKAIDPHGRIGEKILEVGTFIENEIWNFGESSEQIRDIIYKVAKNMDEDIRTIAIAAFIIIVLSTAWSIEGNEMKMAERNYSICKELSRYI